MAVALDEWVARMGDEYLDRFVPRGGSGIKFVVAADAQADQLRAKLRDAAGARAMMFLEVDAADVKLHMIQDLFFAVARAVEWERIAQAFVEAVIRLNAYTWPRPGQPATIDEIAEANGIAPILVDQEIKRWLSAAIWKDLRMTQDFRNAMLRLCLSRLEPGSEQDSHQPPVLEWLRGQLRAIAPLKRAGIFARIGRHNARAMLSSLCRWIAATRNPGLVLVVDVRRLGMATRQVASGHRYSIAAVMDAFEVLRQLIDDIESFERLFLVVVADNSFTDGLDEKRRFSHYLALHMRIANDVRASGADNPLAPLVHLGA